VHARRARRGSDAAFAAVLIVILAAWNNVVVTRLPGYPGSYVPANLAAAGLLLGAARTKGITWEELGLARNRLRSGMRWGAAFSAVVAVGCAAALALPGVRPLVADARAAGLGTGELASTVLVRIPLGTALWEEVAFRGVLLAVLARVLPLREAIATSATVFGLWHVRPTLSAIAANDLVDGPLLRGLAVGVGCLVSTAAGVLFTWLRLRSGSLIAPFLLHSAANALGTLTAASAHRLA
jgi:membrane protease YdiL (CAAX protease family)